MHINYHRHEDRKSNFRREHGRMTHSNCCKDKRDSHKWYKKHVNRQDRRRAKRALRKNPEMIPRHRKRVRWIAS